MFEIVYRKKRSDEERDKDDFYFVCSEEKFVDVVLELFNYMNEDVIESEDKDFLKKRIRKIVKSFIESVM